MSRVSLDAFQLLIAVYLFYVAIKGSGTLYNFPEIPEKRREEVRQRLRKIFALCGVIALFDGCVSMLQNSMFSVEYTEAGEQVTQNFTIGVLPFLSYTMLSVISAFCTVAFVLILVGVIIYIRKMR